MLREAEGSGRGYGIAMKHCPTCTCKQALGEYSYWMAYDFLGGTLAMNSKIDRACRALDSAGFRFLVDFGVDNAVDIAEAEIGPLWDSGDSSSARIDNIEIPEVECTEQL